MTAQHAVPEITRFPNTVQALIFNFNVYESDFCLVFLINASTQRTLNEN